MEHSLHSSAPTAMIRPRGEHGFEVFSPKLSRRLTIYRRVVLDAWMLIESDPSVVTFSERPGMVLIGERYHQVDFSYNWTTLSERLHPASSPTKDAFLGYRWSHSGSSIVRTCSRDWTMMKRTCTALFNNEPHASCRTIGERLP